MKDMTPASRLRIAFYDSGIGGLPYFKRTAELIPEADYRYLADSAHFPLGEKRRDQVLAILEAVVVRLINLFDPRIIVIACNTASVVALADLREKHPGTPFVGTVPAVKPAALRSKTGRIAVVATSRAIADPYTASLVRRFASGIEVILVAAPAWVDFVERRWLGSTLEERIAVVRPIIEDILSKGADEIVLACTHFLFLEDAIRVVSGDRAEVIDSSEGVSRRVLDIYRESPGGAICDGVGTRRLYSSGAAPNGGHAAMASEYGLEYGGPLP